MATEGASRLIAKPDKQNAGRRSGTARYGQLIGQKKSVKGKVKRKKKEKWMKKLNE